MDSKDPFRDSDYLQKNQYRDSSNLDARAALHRQFSTAVSDWQPWVFELLRLEPGMRVLECGCGPGWLWRQNVDLIPADCHITLTDLSPGMVAEAEVALAESGHRFDFQPANIQALEFADGTFDVVVANHMLYHVPDPGLALGEFRRVLRPDGVALIATNAPGHMHQLNEVVSEVFGPQTLGLNSAFAIDNGEAMLRGHFGAIIWHSYINALAVDDVDAVVTYATSIPPAQHATHDQRRVLADAVRRRMTEGGGSMRIDTRTGAFVCRGRTA